MPSFSRRTLLCAVPAALLAASSRKGLLLPSDFHPYADQATEFPVVRLTSSEYASQLPAWHNYAVSRRSGFLLYCSDRGGSWQVFRLDLKSGQSRQLTEAEALDPMSPALSADDRNFLFLDGRHVRQMSLSSLREREMYRVPDDFEPAGGLAASEDGTHAVLIEKRGELYRLRLIPLAKGSATTLVESKETISGAIPRPRRASVLYRRGDASWLVNYDAQQNYRLKLAPGKLGIARWAPDGKLVLYLNTPEDGDKRTALREFTPDTNEDQAIAPTSQFIHFGGNSDSSVFTGASGSKASPYVLLLVRSVRRELTVCEHRATDPSRVAPVFSTDSQRLYFQSDRDGRWAIYSVNVEKLVAETEQ